MNNKNTCENCAFKDKCEKYKKCLILQEKLDIAVKALKEIEHKCFDKYLMNNGWVAVSELRDVAHYALKELDK